MTDFSPARARAADITAEARTRRAIANARASGFVPGRLRTFTDTLRGDPVQLDLEAGLAAKADGLDRVEFSHPDFVPMMRQFAKVISAQAGEVHIDDLRAEAALRGWRPRHPGAWGAIFRSPGWVKVGARPSAVPSNHGHVSPCWRWEGGA